MELETKFVIKLNFGSQYNPSLKLPPQIDSDNFTTGPRNASRFDQQIACQCALYSTLYRPKRESSDRLTMKYALIIYEVSYQPN